MAQIPATGELQGQGVRHGVCKSPQLAQLAVCDLEPATHSFWALRECTSRFLSFLGDY